MPVSRNGLKTLCRVLRLPHGRKCHTPSPSTGSITCWSRNRSGQSYGTRSPSHTSTHRVMNDRFATRDNYCTRRDSARRVTPTLLLVKRPGSDIETPTRVVSTARFIGLVAPERNAGRTRKTAIRVAKKSGNFKEQHTGGQP